MRRLKLTLEYDGTEFAGFQFQGKGERTVQGTLEETLREITGEDLRVHGAGRTDSGVHATGQVAHFDTGWAVPPERVAVAMNRYLPRDLTVRDGGEAPPGFHARFSATARVYRYTILNREAPSAMLERYALHIRKPLDLSAMREAAEELTGTHDFATFGRAHAPDRSTVRRVHCVEVSPRGACIRITVHGNAFLRQQVRAFVGTLVMAGQGKLTRAGVQAIRDSRDRAQCPPVAPAQGLCLVRVDYTGDRLTGLTAADRVDDINEDEENE